MLYIVGVPIGNLGDITFRAIEVLKNVDCIVCESVLDSKKLLTLLDIKKDCVIKFNDRNKNKAILEILDIAKNKDVAFITSAGMPCISDPGFELVNICRENNINVLPIPGVSALSTAVAMSGFNAKRIIFLGFLPRKLSIIKELLVKYVEEDSLVVFFESPFRVIKSLDNIKNIFSNKNNIQVFVGREMTKKFETYISGSIDEIKEKLLLSPQNLKGEFTLVLKLG